jgi:hypothetical protein
LCAFLQWTSAALRIYRDRIPDRENDLAGGFSMHENGQAREQQAEQEVAAASRQECHGTHLKVSCMYRLRVQSCVGLRGTTQKAFLPARSLRFLYLAQAVSSPARGQPSATTEQRKATSRAWCK